jgi:hypothetical protein
MRRYVAHLCLLVALLLCSCAAAFAADTQTPAAASQTGRVEQCVFASSNKKQRKDLDGESVSGQLPETTRPFFANGKEGIMKDVASQRQPRVTQQFELAATAVDAEVKETASEAANGLPANPALTDAVCSRATNNATVSPNETLSAAEKYGSILSDGVIASVTIALVFACFLLVLVAIEMATNISDFVEHRRMVALRKPENGDDPCEPKYGDFRDTAVNLKV